jgi:hypothetical protein
MRRSSAFAEHSQEEPCSSNPHLHPVRSRTRGPIAFLNPTVFRLEHQRYDAGRKEQGEGPQGDLDPASEDAHGPAAQPPPASRGVEFRWTSRNNRKGRHQLDVYAPKAVSEGQHLLEDTAALRPVLRGILAMVTRYPFWDISWLVAYIFTWGSIVWVINAL